MSHELSQALGHLRQAAHQLLVQTDPTGQTLRLACQILDIDPARLTDFRIAAPS